MFVAEKTRSQLKKMQLFGLSVPATWSRGHNMSERRNISGVLARLASQSIRSL